MAWCLVLACLLHAGAAGSDSPAKNSYYIAGANGSLSFRRAAYEFPEVELRQDTARDNMLLGGFALGRRYGVTKSFRIQVGGLVNFGSALEDTFETARGTQYLMRHSMFHAAIEPELQFALVPTANIEPYVFIGGGADFTRFRERFYYFDEPRQEIEFEDFVALDEKRWCPHAHAGAGFDYIPRTEIGFSLRYSFRFWKPVQFEESGGPKRNIPLQPIPYREYFLTHMLQIQFLLAFE